MPTVPFYDFDTDFVLKVRQTIRVVQSDIGREFVCHAKFNGQKWDLTGFTGTVLGVKPDGNATDTTATIDEDEFKFTLTEQMAAVAGAYEIFLTVENGSDVKIQAPVLLCVLEGADGVISESALGALTELLQASQEALEETSQYATAAAASAEDAEEAADLATAAADSILVDVTDRTPYLLRQSGGGVETGDREYDTIVGGTVAFNQLCNGSSVTVQNGHKYLSKTGSTWTVGASTGTAISNLTSGSDMVIDLTQMFGSTIADYIYSLEQATAGAGVAWFRQYFPEDYYEYNAGELKSVSGVSAHVMRDADENIIGNYPLDDSLTLRGLPKLDGGKLYYDGDTYESDGTVTRKYGVKVFNGSEDWKKSTAANNAFWVGVSGKKAYGDVVNSKYPLTTSPSTYYKTYGVCYSDASLAFSLDPAVVGSTVESFKAWIANNPITVVYELATPTTETADPFTNPQVVDQNGTEEYVTDSIVPVGHETIYRTNLLDNLNNILKAPTADGTYTMKVTVSNGEATYFWD